MTTWKKLLLAVAVPATLAFVVGQALADSGIRASRLRWIIQLPSMAPAKITALGQI